MKDVRAALWEVSPADLCVRRGSLLRSRTPSPFSEHRLLVVDWTARAPQPGAPDLPAVQEALAELPCVTAGVGTVPEALASLAACLDVAVETKEELEPVTEAVARTPVAALALVQQLRLSRRLGIHEGLISESALYGLLQAGPEFAAWLKAQQSREPPGETSEAPVIVERDGSLLRLTLNRPERRNAFSYAMRDALAEAFEVVVADPSITTVRLEAAGEAFCSGGDLSEFGKAPDPATAHGVRSTRHAARSLVHCANRVEAVVQGACIGAGLELAALCRRVTARSDAFFQLPEVEMGLIPGAGGTVSLPRRIGHQRTAWMALTGRRVDAPTAHRWGLVDSIGS